MSDKRYDYRNATRKRKHDNKHRWNKWNKGNQPSSVRIRYEDADPSFKDPRRQY